MKENWDRFVSGSNSGSDIDPVIYRSWLRSQNYRISERILDKEVLPAHLLQERCEEHEPLLRASELVLPHILQIFRDLHYIVLISDREGYVLNAVGDPSFMTRAQKVSLAPGACWHENIKGTNAIGTALAEKTPIKILGSNHFVAENHFLNCWATPIYNSDGEVEGILDISSASANRNQPLLELALMGARMIEQNMRLFQLQKSKHSEQDYEDFFRMPPPTLSPVIPIPVKKEKPLSCIEHHKSIYTSTPVLSANIGISVQVPWLGRSQVTKEVYDLAAKAADSDISVFLQGESGVGKEVMARHIHQMSPRRNGPFVAINCAALPPSLAQSELFGYADGAFTGAKKGGQAGKFELANGGTIFLDEIGDMPSDIQVLLLRVLQEKEVTRIGDDKIKKLNVRVITATHQDLAELVSLGKFRQDLYYRLKVVTITLPPLHKRMEDIWDLAPYFVNRACQSLGKPQYSISGDVYAHLFTYNWPGNIRELENFLYSMVALSKGPVLTAADLPRDFIQQLTVPASSEGPLLSQLTKQAILQTLNKTDGKIAPAARLLGIGRSTLYRKLQEFNIRPKYMMD
ncbi:sigma-54-dependent Fis family transcriptional regulator [Desulfitobacterium sp. AusDCA]|uniref:sigma-54-dependent Fis family transcriptional regulator n=1 Tax=Desulfitobacterium sp. AusDCA TaxID=3240383 RepID=UPI003DA7780B